MTDLQMDMDPTSSTFGDLLITDGNLTVITDTQAELRQTIKQTLSTYLGEWFMDTTLGVDYYGQILVKNPDMGTVNAILIRAILGIPGIVQLLSYDFTTDYIARKLSVRFTARATSGIINYVG